MAYQEEYSTITARYPDGGRKAVHIKKDGKRVVCKLDMSKPVTLMRMRDVLEKISLGAGIEFDYIEVNHVIFRFDVDMPEEEIKAYVNAGDPVPYTKLVDKTYQYSKKSNTLLIWDGDVPVYENSNGVITRDLDALADTYM